jgi:hypothetical protein
MAINVNEVYQTVLLILNKEQRGYITPYEFNQIAAQAQQEIFEGYFDDLNQQLRLPGHEDEYADRVEHIEESISLLRTYSSVSYRDVDENGNPIDNPFFYLPENVHRMGTLMYKDEQEIQRTNRGEYLRLNMSKLTRPTTNYPLFTQEENVTVQDITGVPPATTVTTLCKDCIKVYVYPSSVVKDVSLSYVRKPNKPIWAYTVGVGGAYIYSELGTGAGVNPSTGSVNFEIDDTDKPELILRILAYAGVVIRDPQVVQAAAQQVQATEVNQKS